MSFQTPKSVEEFLNAIHQRDYLMPAIQREFVWGPDQIIRLFDSLMRGYPVGSFLLWDVKRETAQSYTFYEFLTRYHERDNPYAAKATVPAGSSTTAVLDGQQRLTSLNIGLYGSFAEKKKYAWWNSADAFPVKRLYMNLTEDPDNEELGLKYDLKFLTDGDAEAADDCEDKWFRVGAILDLPDSGPAIMKELDRRGIVTSSGQAFQRLYDLYQAVRVLKPMNYFLVSDQDPDKVLEIFVRVNSGGTTLSYSDLLLSMATNQWKELDAREEIRSIVSELNSNAGRQFAFSKDVVLKTALSIAGVDVRFKVSNFTQANMGKVEAEWPFIKGALLRAATLLQQFGYNERNLTANSVIVPIAQYLYLRGASDSYLDSTADASDRLVLQRWVTRSLIKRGVWGSGLDTMLLRIRDILTDDHSRFPVGAIEAAMAGAGKSLSFDAAEVDELLNLKYAGQRTFSVLSILYPGLDLGKKFHEDHIFPKSRFTRKKLERAGIRGDKVDNYLTAVNLLPNLQLLAGTANIEKQDTLPSEWIASAFPNGSKRDVYLADNDLDDLSLDLDRFMEFFEERKLRMRNRLIGVLGRTLAEEHEGA